MSAHRQGECPKCFDELGQSAFYAENVDYWITYSDDGSLGKTIAFVCPSCVSGDVVFSKKDPEKASCPMCNEEFTESHLIDLMQSATDREESISVFVQSSGDRPEWQDFYLDHGEDFHICCMQILDDYADCECEIPVKLSELHHIVIDAPEWDIYHENARCCICEHRYTADCPSLTQLIYTWDGDIEEMFDSPVKIDGCYNFEEDVDSVEMIGLGL